MKNESKKMLHKLGGNCSTPSGSSVYNANKIYKPMTPMGSHISNISSFLSEYLMFCKNETTIAAHL